MLYRGDRLSFADLHFFFFNRKDVSLGVYEAHLPNLGILCIKYGGNFC